ncbi:hypothetical protein NW754_003473 [Fusarium falciforme]|nr:hypothetical protein NW754_003473 [Fusarium falciforme]
MSHQIAFNGKVHPDKNRSQLESFFKKHKIASLIDQNKISEDTTFDYLVSAGEDKDAQTRIYQHAIGKGFPILNEEWMKEVVEAKAWILWFQILQLQLLQFQLQLQLLQFQLQLQLPWFQILWFQILQLQLLQFQLQLQLLQFQLQLLQFQLQLLQFQLLQLQLPWLQILWLQPHPEEPPDNIILDSIASAVNNAKLKADEAVAASNAAEDAYQKHDAKSVFDQTGKAFTAVAAVQRQQQLLDTYIKDSIDNVDDDLVQAASRAVSSELARAVEACGNADKRKTMAQVFQNEPYWGPPVIPDAETKRQEAIADAKAARDAANQAITRAAKLRQDADALAEKAYAIQEAARTKEGSEKDAEMRKFREMTVELPEALQNAKKAEQDAKEADDLAMVRANDAGIPSQDLQQREQSPWGRYFGQFRKLKAADALRFHFNPAETRSGQSKIKTLYAL